MTWRKASTSRDQREVFPGTLPVGLSPGVTEKVSSRHVRRDVVMLRLLEGEVPPSTIKPNIVDRYGTSVPIAGYANVSDSSHSEFK